MQMSEEEICFRFKRNGCQKRHIKILAELNAVEQKRIEEILVENGFLQWRKHSLQNPEKTRQNL